MNPDATPRNRRLPPLPARMRSLPVSEHGYPVPYFVAKVDGRYNFQLADQYKWSGCVAHGLCWICGQPLGVFKTFVAGPMAALNRISAEPPSHLECAEFAVRACPFMVLPKAQRRDIDAATPHHAAPGIALAHNPGVMLLWTTKNWKLARPQRNQRATLIEMGTPTTVRWYAQGREATRAEALAALDAGLPHLLGLCEDEADRAMVEQHRQRLMKMLPHEPAP